MDLTGNFKIEAWVNRTDDNGHTMGVVTKYNEGESGGYVLMVGRMGEVYCRTFNSAGDRSDSYSDYNDPRNITVGSGWHKIAAERFGGTCRVYIDDVDVTKDFADHSEVAVSSAPVQIGAGINTYTDIKNFMGVIDEIKIYDFVPKQQASLPDAVAKWSMNENAGDTVADVSGNGNDGTADGTTIVDGISSFSRSFNGSSDYVHIDDPQTIPVGNDPRTVSLWFNSNITYGSRPVTLFQYGTSNLGQQFSLIVRSDWEPGKLYFWGHWADAVVSEVLVPNTWYHAAVSYDGTNVRMYLNGVLKSQTALGLNTVMDGNEFRIGNGTWNGDNSYWDGEIDELKIYDSALSDQQVETDYLLNKPEPTKIGWWPMNEASGDTAADSSGNNNAGMATGAVVDDGIKGNARSFSGGTDRVSVPDSDLWDFGSNNWTVGYWVYHTDPVGSYNAHIMHGTNHTGGKASWFIRRQASGELAILTSNTGNSWPATFHGTTTITSDTWHYIVAQRDGNRMRLYLDGRLEFDKPGAINILDVNDELTIGSEKTTTGVFGNGMDGLIDDVKIYDSVLTASEIAKEYDNNSVNHNFSAQINIIGEGRHNLHICAADNAGWHRTWTGEYNLDITPPLGGSVTIANLDSNDYAPDFKLSLEINRGSDNVSGMSENNNDYLLEVSTVPLVADTCTDLGNIWVDASVDEMADSSSYLLNAAIDTCYQFRYTVKDNAGNDTIYLSNIAKVGDTPAVSPLFNPDTMESGNLQVLLTDSRPKQEDHITVSYQNSIAQTITDGSLKLTIPTEFDLTSLTVADVSIGGSDVAWENPIVDVDGKTIVFPFIGSLDDTDGLITILIGETNFVLNPENTGSYKFFMAGYVSDDGTGDPVEEYTADVAIMDGVTVTAMIPSSLTFSVLPVGLGEEVNSEVINTESQASLINFNVVEPGNKKVAAHDLRVSTNAADGFEVTLQAPAGFSAANGDLIAAFPGTNSSPVEWSSPAMGHHGFFGYTTEDETLGSSPISRFAGNRWAGPSSSYQEVMYHFAPVDGVGLGEGIARIGYQIEIDDLQPAGVYRNELIYICTATY